MTALTLVGAVVVGLTLGLFGGGGSILTVPLLVYVAGVPAKAAIAMSLFVVGATSVVSAVGHARACRIRWRTGLVFGLAGMAGAYGGGLLGPHLPATALLAGFALMMMATAAAMIRGRRPAGPAPARKDLPILHVVAEGVVVGLVTGVVGAGGGFLVVPALVLLDGMPMATAVATSLVVIAMKSFAGLAGYLQTVPVDWSIALPVTAAAVVGGLAGGWLAGRIQADRLRKGFGWFVLVMGGFVLIQQAPSTLFHAAWGVAALLTGASVAAAGIVRPLLRKGRHRDHLGPAHRGTQPHPTARAEKGEVGHAGGNAHTVEVLGRALTTGRPTAAELPARVATAPSRGRGTSPDHDRSVPLGYQANRRKPMFFTQYYLDCLSQASYLIGDTSTGRAVVVDPRRDVSEYLTDAEAHGLRIEGVINTHFHADFLAGHLELAARTGAWIGYGRAAEAEYAIRRLSDGERIELGDVVLEILETPGHTPESISVLVLEHAADSVPYGVLTGDALFIGDVGRPDLLASLGMTSDQLGRMLYDSVQHKLMGLPDEVRIFPAHGAGSACGKNLSTERTSTIGMQRVTNYACRPMSEQEFLSIVTEGQPPAPGYFIFDAVLNRKNHDLLDVAAHARPLTAEEFLARRAAGAVVLDARDAQEFALAHLRGSLSVPADGRFAERAGTVIEPGSEIVVVAPQDREVEVVTRLARIGFDTVTGYLREPEAAFLAGSDEIAHSTRLTATELCEALRAERPPFLLDVRNASELADGGVEGAVNIPLAQLPARLAEVPDDRPVVVYCAGGARSAIAVSLLEHSGRAQASDLIGGYGAWLSAFTPSSAGSRSSGDLR
ncbi:TSUP family transporter [Microbispora sp. H10670]|uniref:TSUP family transporter n=1 Tax=Microbispora sp. H10670 TaxID=2729108 RepID=UPI001602EDE5|nr:TSUP family transporter [Microbispora sp. H10670]